MTRREPARTYTGSPCRRCGGVERRVANRHCNRCYAERRQSDEWRERNQERYLTEKFRERHRRNQREYRCTSDVAKDNLKAGQHRRRARKANAIPSNADLAAINREFAKLAREAKRLRMAIDHRVPLKPCRVCGARGKHEASNWALLPGPINASKGNRCMSCYMLDTGSPVIVWERDKSSGLCWKA